jgi:LacI family transcriptional regulator
MKITMRDIAKMAGVSQSTVSKILNNYDDIGEETKQKVLAILEETGYRAAAGRAYGNKKKQLIAVVFAGRINVGFNHPMFVDVMNSVERTLGILGYDMLFLSNAKYNKEGSDYLEDCRHYQIDGCIIIGGGNVQASIDELDQSDIACIGVDIQLTGNRSGYVMSNNLKISAKVVEHFYLLGYRDIAYIGGTPSSKISYLRTEGFKQALKEYGLSIRDEWFLHGDFYEESGYLGMKQILESGALPQAIFAASDLMAFGAIRALKDSGFKAPQDIAVVGCDDIEASRFTYPPLTTVRQDKDKLGKIAAYMLVDLMNRQIDSSAVMVEPELIVRESCGEHLRMNPLTRGQII